MHLIQIHRYYRNGSIYKRHLTETSGKRDEEVLAVVKVSQWKCHLI